LWVVIPEPKPILATVVASGRSARGNAAAMTIVISSAVLIALRVLILASGLPLVAMTANPSLNINREILAVLPSR
jgi:hypothetical protein